MEESLHFFEKKNAIINMLRKHLRVRVDREVVVQFDDPRVIQFFVDSVLSAGVPGKEQKYGLFWGAGGLFLDDGYQESSHWCFCKRYSKSI